MSGGTPARQLLLLLGDEGAVAEQPIEEVVDELAALGLDASATIAMVRKQTARPAPQPTPAPQPIPEPTPMHPVSAVEPAAPVRRIQPVEPEVPVEPAAPLRPAYGTVGKGPDLMADIGTRAGGAAEIEESKERKERKERRKGGLALGIIGLFAASAAAAAVVVSVWPEVLDMDPATVLATLVPEKTVVEAEPQPDQPAPEVTVSRVEPVPPPQPEPVVVVRPEPAPAPPPQPVAQVAVPAPAAQPPTATDPNAPLNIVPKVQAPPVQEARLPENVARPFTPPPAIVAFVPVERELLVESGTGVLSSGSRAGGGPTADERRLATRVAEAERIAAGRPIAALVTMSGADESYDAVILKRPRVEEDRTIADADPSLIPIMGDVAHLFDLVRLAPQ